MSEKEAKVATTVKIPAGLYDELKILGIRHHISLQTLVEKCVYLFVTNNQVSSSFRETIANYTITAPKVTSVAPAVSSSVVPTPA